MSTLEPVCVRISFKVKTIPGNRISNLLGRALPDNVGTDGFDPESTAAVSQQGRHRSGRE